MALAIIQLLAAMFKAFPKMTELVECALDMAAAANVAEAIERKQKKDATVDAAIDKGVGNDCEAD